MAAVLPRLIEPRRAQLQDELGRVDRRRTRRPRGPGTSTGRALQRAGRQCDAIGRVQGQHQHAEHVFPIEGMGRTATRPNTAFSQMQPVIMMA